MKKNLIRWAAASLAACFLLTSEYTAFAEESFDLGSFGEEVTTEQAADTADGTGDTEVSQAVCAETETGAAENTETAKGTETEESLVSTEAGDGTGAPEAAESPEDAAEEAETEDEEETEAAEEAEEAEEDSEEEIDLLS